MVRVIVFVVVLLFFLTGCAPKRSTHKTQAQAFCDAHNPATWQNVGQNVDTQDSDTVQRERIKHYRAIVVSDECRAIFKELAEGPPPKDRYLFYQSRISRLTGEPWECEYFKLFFTNSYNRENPPVEAKAP